MKLSANGRAGVRTGGLGRSKHRGLPGFHYILSHLSAPVQFSRDEESPKIYEVIMPGRQAAALFSRKQRRKIKMFQHLKLLG